MMRLPWPLRPRGRHTVKPPASKPPMTALPPPGQPATLLAGDWRTEPAVRWAGPGHATPHRAHRRDMQ